MIWQRNGGMKVPGWRRVAGAMSAGAVVLLVPCVALAANIPTFDVGVTRTRTVDSTALSNTYIRSTPFYVPIAGQQSYSTPVVVGSDLYQYTFTSAGQGTLWEFAMSAPPSSCFANGQSCAVPWSQVNKYTWNPGWANGINQAGGASSPTIAQGYTSIAVGKDAYSWTTGSPQSAEQKLQIGGNPGQNINQIDEAPLITPPLTASGISLTTGATTKWTSPYVVVGSWNGGFVSYPLYVPSGIEYTSERSYTTYEDFHHTGSYITSSPTWDSANKTVLFGIAVPSTSGHHPRVVDFNPVTGAHHYFGVGTIKASVDSSVAIGPNGNVYVPDQSGGVYEFTPGGSLVAQNQQFAEGGLNISDLAVSSHAVYAVGDKLSVLASMQLGNLSTNWVDRNLGTGLFSPSVVDNGNTDLIFISGASKMYAITQNGHVFQAAGSPTPSWVSAIADAGPDHWVITWTDSNPAHQSALEVWEPMNYQITAWTNPATAVPGQSITLYTLPAPQGVTQQVSAAVPAYAGGTQTLQLQHQSPTGWDITFPAPKKPGTYTIPVAAATKADLGLLQNGTATAKVSVTITVQPNPGTQTASAGSGNLTLQSYGLANLTHLHPEGTTKLGDTIVATLTVPRSDITVPSGATLVSAHITKATLTQPYGETNFTSTTNDIIVSKQDEMTPNGLTATTKFLENWSGFPPPIPPQTQTWSGHITVDWIVHGRYSYQVQVQACSAPNKCQTTTQTRYKAFTVSGTANAPLTVTGTDWYIIGTQSGGSGL